jgi:superfamily I DNA/RNA helicase
MFNPQQAGSFLESAARSASQQYASSGITQAYARDEVSWVIKGRGLTTLAEYLKVSRDGRGSPLRPDQRATMWAIAADYERRLGKAGLLDENDLLIEATKLVQSEGLAAPYSLVVVDEAQDLTLVGARLVAAIAERSGGQLLILGDGHQSIYPGSFRLIDAGIDVRGRARVLTRNYRNGFEILRAAEAVADSEGAEDPLDRGDAELPGTPTRLDPGLVALTQFNSGDDLRIGVAIEIERLTKNGVRTGDIAILVPTNQQVDNWATQMRDFNQPTMKLASYEGRTTHHIKIGTYHRAKGLEFKHVLMPAVDAVNTQDARRTGEDDRDYAERQGLMRRRMFVAMTRARDSLWMGWTGPASTSIAKLIKLG